MDGEKYADPLDSSPCAKTLCFILFGARDSEELLALGAANSKNTLYEILASLEKKGCIEKDNTVKPMPIIPKIDALFDIFIFWQKAWDLPISYFKEELREFEKKFKAMRNKSSFRELGVIYKKLAEKMQGEGEIEKDFQKIKECTPQGIKDLMQRFLEAIGKISKPQRKQLSKIIGVVGLRNFYEVVDSFFCWLYLNQKQFSISEDLEVRAYVNHLSKHWNTIQVGRGLLIRNSEMRAMLKSFKADGLL